MSCVRGWREAGRHRRPEVITGRPNPSPAGRFGYPRGPAAPRHRAALYRRAGSTHRGDDFVPPV